MTYAPDASEYPVDVQHVGVQRLIGVGHLGVLVHWLTNPVV